MYAGCNPVRTKWQGVTGCNSNDQVTVFCYPAALDILNTIAFWKVPWLRPFILLVRATCRWRVRAWSVGKILVGGNRSFRRKKPAPVPLCPRILYGLVWNRTRSFAAPNTENIANCVQRLGLYRAINTVPIIKTSQLMLYREVIAVCSQIHTKHEHTVWAERIIYEYKNGDKYRQNRATNG
jgi:hypothetical protein